MKYIFFNSQTQYSDFLYSELKKREDIVWYINPKNKYIRFIRDMHTSIKGNALVQLPFQRIWYRSLFDKDAIQGEECVFIFEEGNKFGYSKQYLKYLKKRYINSKYVFIFANPAHTIPDKYIKIIDNNFDLVISFNQYDCQKRGYIHYSGIYSRIEVKKDESILESDVFFVGEDKGRLGEILKIYYFLSSKGIKCDFYVSGVAPKYIEKISGIHYNHYLNYEEVIQHVQMSKCILEVLQKKQNGSSLRAMEALIYEKKLISNNKNIKVERYYNENQMFIYESYKEIDIDFIKDNTQKYAYDGSVSPDRFINFISKRLKV